MSTYESWGRFPKVSQDALAPAWLHEVSLTGVEGTLLPYGQGRSYGDSCLNDGGTVVSSENLRRLISFDPESGVLECEGGVTLEEIIDFGLPRGWFLPVSPGTKYVSVAGAIANDIHGKNHHRAGTFGRHVLSFRLLRSDGSITVCSPHSERELFSATVGGLGLTGFILSTTIQLKKVAGGHIDVESIKCRNLDEFFDHSSRSDVDFEYTVSWIDCLAGGDSLGRGIFMRGNHSEETKPIKKRPQVLAVPFDLPGFTLNRLSVQAFNFLYYNKQTSPVVKSTVPYGPFFYPLDSVRNWNRIYGKRGFLQFQCVVPSSNNNAAIRTILETIVRSGKASFLAVLKEFGDIPSPGLLSFPRKGVTLCLDFPFAGEGTLKLFSQLDSIVAEVGGAIYPAKDATMSGEHFKQYFPKWKEFSNHIDPKFSSSFWRRMQCEP